MWFKHAQFLTQAQQLLKSIVAENNGPSTAARSAARAAILPRLFDGHSSILFPQKPQTAQLLLADLQRTCEFTRQQESCFETRPL